MLGINGSEVQSRISLGRSGNNPAVMFFFQEVVYVQALNFSSLVVISLQTRMDEEGLCFFIYEVETTPSPTPAEANATNHGKQIPELKEASGQLLSLTVNSSLVVNELYSATIRVITSDGSADSIGVIDFSK